MMEHDPEFRAFSRAAALCVSVCLLVFVAPLAVASIAVSQQPSTCDHTDVGLNMNVAQWLLGFGVYYLSMAIMGIGLVLVLGYTNKEVEDRKIGSLYFSVLLTVASLMFVFIWTIFGAVILFRSNVDCINQGSLIPTFALVMWCLTTFIIAVSGFSKARAMIRPSNI